MDAAEDLWTSEDLFDAAEEIEDALPVVLTGDAGDLGPEAVDDVFAQVTSRLSPLEAASIGSALRTVGRWANGRAQLGQLASAVLPVAGTAVGTAYGGPLGTALGRTIGERAAQAVAGGKARPAPVVATGATAPTTTPAPAPSPARAAGDGSQAAAKLLYLVQNPAFLSSLVALAVGSQGRSTIPTGAGDQQAPIGAFMNLATSLLGKAAEDADALVGDGESVSDSYLRSETGCLTCDPAVPSQRADALLTLLQREDEAESMIDDPYEDIGEEDVDWEWWSGES